ncbi:hypothetical protein [Lacisediminihabitans sp.]|uniref:hypothetical protein n=1 Tax=Lacisediminihabitans sp. TaxID=2787631 RepID=UPI00374CA70B
MFLLALITRSVVFVACLPVLLLVPLIPGAPYSDVAILATLSAAAVGVSPNWYFLGTGQPTKILLVDSLPRVVAVVASSVLLLFGAPLWISPLFSLLVSLGAPLLAWRSIRRIPHEHPRIALAEIWPTIRAQGNALSGRAVSALYMALPTVLVAIVAPGVVAQFSAAERLMRMTLAVLQSVPNSLQGWLGATLSPRSRRDRILGAILLNLALGVAAGTSYAFLAPWASQVVFTGSVEVTPLLALTGGALVLVVCTSRATGGLGLVNLDRVGWIAISAIAGAVTGLTLILALGSIFKAEGALLGELAAECVVLAVQLFVLNKSLQKLQPEPDIFDLSDGKQR